jgi:predicted amidohydrolase YtcJ
MDKINIDTLLINGKIYTLREEGEAVEAMGIDKGKIVFAGSNSDSINYIASKTIDLEGETVIPGMGDSHLHMYAYCQNQTSVKLDDMKSIDELILTMKEKVQNTESGKWVKGAGFDDNKFVEHRLPTRWDLDKISTMHPIVVRRCCLHVMIANSLAIEMAKINPNMIEESDGLIEIDEKGMMTGIFREKSTIIFDEIVPDPLADTDEKKRIMVGVLEDMVSKGITSINTYAAKIWNYDEDIITYRDLEKEGTLPLRVAVSLDELFDNDDDSAPSKDPYSKVKYGSYKLFTDGSFGARSASLLEPYSDDENNYGILVDRDILISNLFKAYEKGLQPAIHAIGDKALELTLDAIEYVIKNTKYERNEQSKRLPFRIIHAQLVNRDQLERMKKLPIILDIQPIFLCTDLYWIESRLGKDRIKNSYIWKTMMDEGLIMAGGSDCPVESYDPIRGIYAAVMRQNFDGFPSEGWEPSEKISVYQAICLFTKNIAYTTGDEEVLGTIEKNKFADFVVLNSDPFKINPQKLKDIRVLKTFVAGEQVYDLKN